VRTAEHSKIFRFSHKKEMFCCCYFNKKITTTRSSLANFIWLIIKQFKIHRLELISFIIRHQLVQAISNVSLRMNEKLKATLDIRNFVACWNQTGFNNLTDSVQANQLSFRHYPKLILVQ